jgi:hypothetical protein
MADPIDQEVEAIREVLSALSPLSEQARASVLDYVTKRLGLPTTARTPEARITPNRESPALPDLGDSGSSPVHIKDLKDQKKPRSANEMAALVAYYLSSLAPADKRKRTVNQKDMETYFKIAEFPLPNQIRVTLANAKTAGYFDAAGSGEYKLNAVGHNLVVHSMPRGGSEGSKRTRKKGKGKGARR